MLFLDRRHRPKAKRHHHQQEQSEKWEHAAAVANSNNCWFGLKALAGFVLIAAIAASIQPTDAVIAEAIEIVQVLKAVKDVIVGTWDIVQKAPVGQKIHFPLMREKQAEVLKRLKEVSREIDKSEEKYANHVAAAVQSLTDYVSTNIPLITKLNDISETMNRISSRFELMRKYEVHQEKLEAATLITFSEWTVSPNAYSVHQLMDTLHLTLLGPVEKENSTENMLAMLARSYEVSPKTNKTNSSPVSKKHRV